MKKYENYKDSGIEWIGKIPSTWKISRFNHNFSFSRGLPITKQDLKDSGIPCVSYGEIHSKFGRIVDPEKHQLKFADESFLESNPNSLLSKGDFLFADTSEDLEGSGNFTCLDSDIPTFAGYHTVIARLLDRNEFDYKYLSYFLDSIEYRNQIKSSVSGVKVFSITQGILKGTSIVIPPPKEQVAIASYLDRKTAEIDELIADKKRLLELYEEEKLAVINQAITKGINSGVPMKDSGIEWLGEIPEHWELKKLKHVAQVNPTKNFDYKDSIEEVVFLPMEKVGEDGSYKCDIKKTVSELWSGFTYFERGDIIIAKITPCFENRKGALLDNLVSEIGFGSTEFHVLRANSVLPMYLFYITRSELFMEFGEAFMTGAAGQKRVPTNFISEFEFCFPETLEEQHTIAHYIKMEFYRIDDKKAKTQKLIDLLTEYRTALISEVVTGKVKVTD